MTVFETLSFVEKSRELSRSGSCNNDRVSNCDPVHMSEVWYIEKIESHHFAFASSPAFHTRYCSMKESSCPSMTCPTFDVSYPLLKSLTIL